MSGTTECLAEKPSWLLPLGVTTDGRMIWPITGAEKDDDGDDDDPDNPPGGDDSDDDEDDDDADQDGDGDDGEDDSKKGKSKKKDGDDDEDDDSDLSYWKDRAQSYKRRMEAADRRATAAERENRRLKAAGTDALDEPGKQDLTETKAALKTAEETANNLRLQLAIATDTTYKWHDPALVIKALADDDDVEIDENGKVVGVKQALRRLARSKPYLVDKGSEKDAGKDDEDDDAEDEGKPPARRSGGAQNGRKRRSTVPDRNSLVKQYPALARRG